MPAGRVAFRASPIDAAPAALRPDELEVVAQAVASRQCEFATGRRLAREALAAVGHGAADASLLPDDDRVPRWPQGAIGTISHTQGLCVAGVSANVDTRGLGLDVEPDVPAKPGIERRVCLESESRWIAGAEDEVRRGQRLRQVFSAKEAVYKAFYPSLRTFWKFHDVELQVDASGACFSARLPEGAGRERVDGVWVRRFGFVVSLVHVSTEGDGDVR